jgi:TonB family protein
MSGYRKTSAAIIALILLAALPVIGQTDTIETSEPDVEPQLLEFVDAVYPPQALRAGREGSVVLELLVNAEGGVDTVSVYQALEPALDAAAVEAAAGFRFSPAMVEGEPVPVWLLFEYTFSIAQEARRIQEYVNFSGVLREKGTRDRVAYASVVVDFPEAPVDTTLSVPWTTYLERIGGFEGQYLETDYLVAMTDSTGRFAFKSLPAGPFRVSFPNAGYELISEEEYLGYDEHLQGRYVIPRTNYDEYEIVVYGKAEQKEVTRQRLNVTEVERIPGFGGDAIKSVQALPGVARPPFVSGDIIVRGSGFEDTRYFLDGVEIPMLFHYGGLKSTYNSSVLSSIDLYPGGFGNRYGACVGGVIEISGRQARRDRWGGALDAGILDSSFLAEGPLGEKWGLQVTGRRSFIGEVANAALKDNDSFNMAAVPYYWDTVARLDYQRTVDDLWFLTLFAAKDRMEVISNEENVGSSEVSEATDALNMSSYFRRVILGNDRRFGDRVENELRFALGRDNYSANIFGYMSYDFKSDNITLRDELSFKQNDALTWRVGADLAWFPLDYDVRALGIGTSLEEKTFSDLGGYAGFEWRPTDRLLLIPGYRYDYYEELAEGASSYRLTSHYELNDAHTLSGAVGTYNQSPTPRGQAIDPLFGNPDLPPTTATHFTVGDSWRLTDMINLKTDVYYNLQKQIPLATDSLDLHYLPDQDARMYGLEVMLRRDQGNRFFGWISYTLSRSERRMPRAPRTDIAGTWDPDAWRLSEYDQTHHIEAVGSWNLGSTWSGGIRMRYVTGNPTTPVLGYESDQYAWDGDTGDYVDLLGNYRSGRMGPFFQFDVRLDKKFVYKNWILSTYIDIQNLNYFAYNSPEFYNYSFDSSERNTVGGLLIPTFGIKAEF